MNDLCKRCLAGGVRLCNNPCPPPTQEMVKETMCLLREALGVLHELKKEF